MVSEMDPNQRLSTSALGALEFCRQCLSITVNVRVSDYTAVARAMMADPAFGQGPAGKGWAGDLMKLFQAPVHERLSAALFAAAEEARNKRIDVVQSTSPAPSALVVSRSLYLTTPLFSLPP
jgi:hypothetical protein